MNERTGTMANTLLPTTVVGSYAQPDWLIDRDGLKSRLPPRVRAKELWRVLSDHLDEAQDDATLVAIRDMERAGVDIITDGEIRRERSEEHTSELRSLMRISYAVFCLKKKQKQSTSTKDSTFERKNNH